MQFDPSSETRQDTQLDSLPAIHDNDTNVTAPLTQTNKNLGQQSAKTPVSSSIGSMPTPHLSLPHLTTPAHTPAQTATTIMNNIHTNHTKSCVHSTSTSHTHQNNPKNTQQSGLKNVSACPSDEQKALIAETMGALPPAGIKDSTLSPLKMATQAHIPTESPSPTPTSPAPMNNNNNDINSPPTESVRSKSKTQRKTRRGGDKPPHVSPQLKQTSKRTKTYRKIPQIPKQLQAAKHTQLPTKTTKTNPNPPDKQDRVDTDTDLLD